MKADREPAEAKGVYHAYTDNVRILEFSPDPPASGPWYWFDAPMHELVDPWQGERANDFSRYVFDLSSRKIPVRFREAEHISPTGHLPQSAQRFTPVQLVREVTTIGCRATRNIFA